MKNAVGYSIIGTFQFKQKLKNSKSDYKRVLKENGVITIFLKIILFV